MNAISKFNPHFPVNRLWFDDFFNKEVERLFHPETVESKQPLTNVWEDDKHLFVDAVLPGLEKDDIKINIENDIVTVSGEKKKESEEKTKDFLRKEFSSVKYSRSFRINPEQHQLDKIDAKLENGILKLSIPKKEVVKNEASFTVAVK